MLKKLVEYLGREVEVWTTENTEPWMGILKEANADYIMLMIDELQTFLVTNKIVAFRLSEGEQGDRRRRSPRKKKTRRDVGRDENGRRPEEVAGRASSP